MDMKKLHKMTRLKLADKRRDQPFNMIAIITVGGKIVSIGYNRYDRLSYSWKQENGFKKLQGIHAELDAIRRWKNKKSGATMTIFGVTKHDRIMQNSFPCKHCLNALRATGITKVRFLRETAWAVEKISGNH